jgi:hypothetical protein
MFNSKWFLCINISKCNVITKIHILFSLWSISYQNGKITTRSEKVVKFPANSYKMTAILLVLWWWNKRFLEELITYFLVIWTAKKMTCPTWPQLTFLPSHCLVSYTDWRKAFMKYAVQMGSDAMIYIPRFILIDSRVQKLIKWDSQTAW